MKLKVTSEEKRSPRNQEQTLFLFLPIINKYKEYVEVNVQEINLQLIHP